MAIMGGVTHGQLSAALAAAAADATSKANAAQAAAAADATSKANAAQAAAIAFAAPRDAGALGIGAVCYGRHINSTWAAGTTQDGANIYLMRVSAGAIAADSGGGAGTTWKNISGAAIGVNELRLIQRIA